MERDDGATSMSGYNYLASYGGHSYFRRVNYDYRWYNATTTAQNNGGYLMIIDTPGEYEFLRSTLYALAKASYNSDYWIGLRQAPGMSTNYNEGWYWYGRKQDTGLFDSSIGNNSNVTDANSTPWENTVTVTQTTNFDTTLKAGEVDVYTASYVITQSDVDSGAVINVVSATSSSPGNTNDVTDMGDDPNTAAPDDPTVVTLVASNSLDVTKTATVSDVNGNSANDVGDIITYTITISNTGNQTLSSVTISDTLTDGARNNLNSTLASITFVSASPGSTSTTLIPGGAVIYTTSTTITNISSTTAFIQNVAIVTASSPGQANNVSDTADDGDDTDGELLDDPTQVMLVPNAEITASKTASTTDNGDGMLGVGDIIIYTITVTNTGNLTLTGITLDDNLKNGNGTVLSLNTSPTFVSSSQGSVSGTLLYDEGATYTASYTITQADVDSGLVSNSLIVTASSPGQTNNVSDTSDVGNIGAGDTDADPTITNLPNINTVTLKKLADVIDVDGDGTTNLGDIIKYTFEITNTGNSSLNSVTLVDNLTAISGAALTNSITIIESSTNLVTKSNFYNGWTQSGTQHFGYNFMPDQIMYYFTSSSGLTSAQLGNALVDGKNYIDYMGNPNGNPASDSQANSRRIRSTGGAAPMYYQNFNFDPNATYTISVYAKAYGGQGAETFRLFAHDGFNIGALSDTQIIDAAFKSTFTLTGDWTRYQYTFKTSSGATAGRVGISNMMTGNGSYFWGIQLEKTQGATPFIYTYSSTVTRPQSLIGDYANTIVANETIKLVGYYPIAQDAVDAGAVSNTAVITASSPGQTNNVSDTSDDGDAGNGNNNQTQTDIDGDPKINVVKTDSWTDNNGNSKVDIGDLITYTITVSNTGNTSLSSITLTDTFTTSLSETLTLTTQPSRISSSMGSSLGNLKVGENAVYVATFIINQAAFVRPFIQNKVNIVASAQGLTGNAVSYTHLTLPTILLV